MPNEVFPSVASRDADREKIEQETAAFLAAGGSAPSVGIEFCSKY